LRWLLATLVCLGLAAGPAAAQRGQAYCTVKDIKAEQLSNGVRITIEADGQLQWGWDIAELFRSEGLKIQIGPWGEWDYFTEKFTTLPLVLRNAKSGLGSAFIPIGKYPVSHAAISIPAWASQNDGIGLRVDIVNYLGAAVGERSLFIDPTKPPWEFTSEETGERYSLMIRRPDDRQGLIISWTSDRFPPPPPPKTPEDLPTELSVTGGADRITVKALNARFQEVASAISACTGLKIDSPPDTDLRVTCDLWNLPPDRAIDGIAAGLGLCGARLSDGSWLVAADVTASGGYAAAASRRIPVQHLRARDVLFLLPNFLVKYVQVDEAGNALTAVGPDWMVQRVADDVAKLDAPPREVTLDVALVEYTSATALARALHGEHLIGDTAFAFDSLLGDISFLWLPGLEQGWSAVLDNLKAESAGKLRSTASLRVMSSRQGKLFAGQQRTLVVQQFDPNLGQQVANLETVDVGTTLIVQPQLGAGDEVMLRVRVQVNSLRETDPATGLPEIGQRSAECSIRVRDSDTIAIAGLELNDETREGRKIPILGDVPLVGSLFRAPAKSRSATHLAIFVTPHIVGSGEQAAGRIVGQEFISCR
jgi:hypothetical protein